MEPIQHKRFCPSCKTEWSEEEVALQECGNCHYPDDEAPDMDELDSYYPDGD